MKNPIYKNDFLIEQGIKDIETAAHLAQSLLDTFQNLKFDIKIENINQLHELASVGEIWVKTKLAETIKSNSFFGFKMKPNRIIEFIELPPLDELNAKAKLCQNHLSCFQYLSLKNSEVLFLPTSKDRFILSNCLFASTPDQEQLRAAHEEAARALTGLNNAMKKAGLIRINPDIPYTSLFKFSYASNTMGEPFDMEVKINDAIYRELISALA